MFTVGYFIRISILTSPPQCYYFNPFNTKFEIFYLITAIPCKIVCNKSPLLKRTPTISFHFSLPFHDVICFPICPLPCRQNTLIILSNEYNLYHKIWPLYLPFKPNLSHSSPTYIASTINNSLIFSLTTIVHSLDVTYPLQTVMSLSSASVKTTMPNTETPPNQSWLTTSCKLLFYINLNTNKIFSNTSTISTISSNGPSTQSMWTTSNSISNNHH